MSGELNTVQPAITPMEMLSIAVSQGADLAKIEKLMDLQERWERGNAEKAFIAAMAAFKANPPTLKKNATVDFSSSKGRTTYNHATLDEVALKIAAAMAPHGLSFRWNVEQPGRVRVSCIVQHSQGHRETVTMEGAPDDSGNKNSIQAIGSTVSYLQRYTLLAASGMAVVGDDDDDGAGSGASSGAVQFVTDSETLEDLKARFEEEWKLAGKAKNPKLQVSLTQARDKRLKELKAVKP